MSDTYNNFKNIAIIYRFNFKGKDLIGEEFFKLFNIAQCLCILKYTKIHNEKLDEFLQKYCKFRSSNNKSCRKTEIVTCTQKVELTQEFKTLLLTVGFSDNDILSQEYLSALISIIFLTPA
jgi:hypothetical protein